MGAIGFASKATGGAGGKLITVDSGRTSGSGTLQDAIDKANASTGSTIIEIASGVVVQPIKLTVVASNLTIRGVDDTHVLGNVGFEFDFSQGNNIILSNLCFRSDEACTVDPKQRDCIKILAEAMKTTRQAIWIDRCRFQAYYDMCITSNSATATGRGPLLITVSNCHFFDPDPTNQYARNHGAIGIHGVGDLKTGNTLATICNNYFRNVRRRSPRCSNGCFTHAFNNVLDQWGAGASTDQVNGMDSGNGGRLVAEANWFQAGAVFKETIHVDGSGAALTVGASPLQNIYRNGAVATVAVGTEITTAELYAGAGVAVPPTPKAMTTEVKDAIIAGAGPR
jgi:pectate lyase